MNKEWDNPINPFNSMKVLFHAEQLKQISEGNFPPPNSSDTDGSNICNLRCVFCNSQVYRENCSYESMPPGHLLRLADFYANWGIRSTCFHPNTLIITTTGVKKIIDVSPGDEVLCLSGDWNVVNRFFSLKGPGHLIQLGVQGANLEVTEDHKFLVVETRHCSNRPDRKIICRLPCREKDHKYCGKKFYQKYKVIEKRADNLKKDDLLLIPGVEYFTKEDHVIKFKNDSKKHFNRLPHEVQINEEVAYFLGWYVAEGSSYKSKTNLAMHIKEIGYAQELINIVHDHFGLRGYIRQIPEHKTLHLEFFSKEFASFLSTICGRGALNKRIPDIIPKKYLSNFMRGLFLGDGYMPEVKEDRRGFIRNRVVFASISPTLIDQVRNVLIFNFNIFPHLSIKKASGMHKEAYYMEISGTSATYLRQILRDRNSKEIIVPHIGNRKGECLLTIEDKKYIGYPIRELKRVPYSGLVYNLEVNKEHNYTTLMGCAKNCIGGGGESLINPEIKQFIPYVHNKGIEVGLITNGTLLDEDYAKITSEHNRFVGISCNAATPGTYSMIHGANLFNRVITNVERLNNVKHAMGSKLDTNIKFLIHPINYKETYAIAKLSKDMGCSGVHIRPVAIEGISGIDPGTGFNMGEYMSEIEEQLGRAMAELNDENFKVYGVRHKVGDNMERVIRFKKCLATPMNLTFGADGWTYVCFNHRGKENMRVARHYPDPNEVLKVWGTDYHKQILERINPLECPRCTYGLYHQIIEEAIQQDNMFKLFT